MTAEVATVLPASEPPSAHEFEAKPQPAPEVNQLDPMPQFGETPMAPWEAQPIAPLLPSARALAPPDFQQQFVNRCLYPGKNVLDEGAIAFSAPGIPDGTDLMFKANGAEIGGSAFAPLLQPPAPPPDYFGHLLGHPMNPALYDDESIASEEKDADDLEAKETVENPEEASETVDAKEEIDESPVGKSKQDKPSTPELAPAESDASSDYSGDDDFDYFGHIMGHPMNRGNGRKKTPKSKKKKSRKTKSEKVESDEPQVSVLNLFLGGVEVCDREENISHFAKIEDDSSMEMSKEETSFVAADDTQAKDDGSACDGEEQIDQSAFEGSPINNVSALVEQPKVEEPEQAAEAYEDVKEISDEKEISDDAKEEPEKTGPKEVEIAAPAPSSEKPVTTTVLEEPKPFKEVVAQPELKRPDVPARQLYAEKTKDQVVEDNEISGKVRTGPAAPKKKSFFGSLCGSKS